MTFLGITRQCHFIIKASVFPCLFIVLFGSFFFKRTIFFAHFRKRNLAPRLRHPGIPPRTYDGPSVARIFRHHPDLLRPRFLKPYAFHISFRSSMRTQWVLRLHSAYRCGASLRTASLRTVRKDARLHHRDCFWRHTFFSPLRRIQQPKHPRFWKVYKIHLRPRVMRPRDGL